MHQHRALRVPRQHELRVGALAQRRLDVRHHGLRAGPARDLGGNARGVGGVVDTLHVDLVRERRVDVRGQAGADNGAHVTDLGGAAREDEGDGLAGIVEAVLDAGAADAGEEAPEPARAGTARVGTAGSGRRRFGAGAARKETRQGTEAT